jgi:hypothetical protein
MTLFASLARNGDLSKNVKKGLPRDGPAQRGGYFVDFWQKTDKTGPSIPMVSSYRMLCLAAQHPVARKNIQKNDKMIARTEGEW